MDLLGGLAPSREAPRIAVPCSAAVAAAGREKERDSPRGGGLYAATGLHPLHLPNNVTSENDDTALDSDRERKKEGKKDRSASGKSTSFFNPFLPKKDGAPDPNAQSLVGTEGDVPTPKFIKIRALGHGAYGEAWLCKQAETGTLTVVKMMNLPNMSKKEIGYAQSEIQCMASVHHTNIIKYADSHSNGSMLCIAMEFADAGDLRRHTKQRRQAKQYLSESEAMFLFVQAAIAVQHIHSCYMLHRDIKSANVLIMTNGLVKLADFGFSRQYEDTVSRPVAQTFCGTPYYLAPEIWRNLRYSNKAEVWSLGVLLYELLALERPFQSPSLSGLMELITSGTYEPIPAQYSQRLRHLVATLLDTDVVQRPTSLEIFHIPYVREHLDLLRILVNENVHIPAEQRAQWTAETDVLLTKCAGFPPFPLRTDDPAKEGASAAGAPPATTEGAPSPAPPAAQQAQQAPERAANGAEGDINRTIEFRGTVLKLSAIPRVKWSPKLLHLTDGLLVLSDLDGMAGKRAIVVDQLMSAAPITLQAAQVPHVFAVHTKDAKCTWLQAPSDELRLTWLQKIQQAMGVFT